MNHLNEQLEKSYESAREIMEYHAKSFYYAFKQLPLDRFRAITAIYAFCRYADDTVDEQILESRQLVEQQLDELTAAVNSLYDDHSPKIEFSQSWWLAFSDTVQRYHVKKEDVLSQIAGQRKDMDFADLKTDEELVEYCSLVAGSVARMILPLMVRCDVSYDQEDFVESCECLGHGLQLTNILRDIGEDIRIRNRVYLPSEALDKFNVARMDLERWSNAGEAAVVPSEEFIALWEHYVALADDYYRKFEAYIDWYHPDCRLSLMASGRIYRAIADDVRARGYNCFTYRCYTTEEQRAQILKEVQLVLNS